MTAAVKVGYSWRCSLTSRTHLARSWGTIFFGMLSILSDSNSSGIKPGPIQLANCADIYARCDDTNRRLCNQAFFTKVYIDEDNELRVEHNRPFEMRLDPQVNANALTWAADTDKARTSTNIEVGKGSSLVRGVELGGFEPPTFSLRTRRATNCAIAPCRSATASD